MCRRINTQHQIMFAVRKTSISLWHNPTSFLFCNVNSCFCDIERRVNQWYLCFTSVCMTETPSLNHKYVRGWPLTRISGLMRYILLQINLKARMFPCCQNWGVKMRTYTQLTIRGNKGLNALHTPSHVHKCDLSACAFSIHPHVYLTDRAKRSRSVCRLITFEASFMKSEANKS